MTTANQLNEARVISSILACLDKGKPASVPSIDKLIEEYKKQAIRHEVDFLTLVSLINDLKAWASKKNLSFEDALIQSETLGEASGTPPTSGQNGLFPPSTAMR